MKYLSAALAATLLALLAANWATAAGPPNWVTPQHPPFPVGTVVPETTTSWTTDAATGRTLAATTDVVSCSMSLGGVFKSAPWVWGSGATSCTLNVTRVSLQLCLYRTAWLSLMGCKTTANSAPNVSTSMQKDCHAGTNKYYMSGQTTSSTPNQTMVGPLGWVGGQTYTCS